MKIQLQQLSQFYIQKTEASFSSSFLKTLNPPYLGQKKIKNLILKEQLQLSETELLEANTKHQRGSDFFSASYSGEWLFWGISKEKIGLDLEVIKPRDKSLLNIYEADLKQHFGTADWEHFYLLRTAKEAILKASDTKNLDAIEKIHLHQVKEKKQLIGKLAFSWEMRYEYQGKIRKVWSHKNGEIAYSWSIKS